MLSMGGGEKSPSRYRETILMKVEFERFLYVQRELHPRKCF